MSIAIKPAYSSSFYERRTFLQTKPTCLEPYWIAYFCTTSKMRWYCSDVFFSACLRVLRL